MSNLYHKTKSYKKINSDTYIVKVTYKHICTDIVNYIFGFLDIMRIIKICNILKYNSNNIHILKNYIILISNDDFACIYENGNLNIDDDLISELNYIESILDDIKEMKDIELIK